MSSAGLQPEPDCTLGSGQFLTFVVAAPSGCNLACSFCIVRQRREIAETYLTPNDLVRFVREAVERRPTFALAIQGYEPLLPESLAFTQAILGTGRFLGIPTSLVTNGTKLADAVDLLTTLAPPRSQSHLMRHRLRPMIASAERPAHGRRRSGGFAALSTLSRRGLGWSCPLSSCRPGVTIWMACRRCSARSAWIDGSSIPYCELEETKRAVRALIAKVCSVICWSFKKGRAARESD